MNSRKSVNYVISVTFSEPQIIDMRKVFFIECKDKRPVRRKSCAPALRKNYSIQMEKVDSIITNKMQKGEEFEEIWKDILDDKDAKINVRSRRNKSFCLEDVQKP
jgi:hypothetical protein